LSYGPGLSANCYQLSARRRPSRPPNLTAAQTAPTCRQLGDPRSAG